MLHLQNNGIGNLGPGRMVAGWPPGGIVTNRRSWKRSPDFIISLPALHNKKTFHKLQGIFCSGPGNRKKTAHVAKFDR